MVTWTTSSPGDGLHDDVWDVEEIIGVVIVCMLVPFIIIGNVFVIYAVAKFKRLQMPTNYFLVSLAGADICTGIFIPFITIIEVYKVKVDNITLCLAAHCLTMTVGGASMLCLSAVAYDRYMAISRPLEYMAIVTERKIVIFTVASWIYATLIAWAPLYGWYTPLAPSGECSFQLIRSEALVLLLVAMFLPPYVIIFYCYAKIMTVARHHVCAIAAMEMAIHTQLETHFLQRDTKYAKTLAIVIGLYMLLWLPYQLSILVEVVSSVVIEDWVRNYLAFLCYLNSGLNPWVYAFRNKDFKYAFHQMLEGMSHCACERLERTDSMWSALGSSRTRSLSTGNIATTHESQMPPLYVTNSALDLAHIETPTPVAEKRRGSIVHTRGRLGSLHPDDMMSMRSSDGSVCISNVLNHRDSLTLTRESITMKKSLILAWSGPVREHGNIEEDPTEDSDGA